VGLDLVVVSHGVLGVLYYVLMRERIVNLSKIPKEEWRVNMQT
jgi:hypothetical protein